jgi:hypothetical protein
MNSRSFCSLFLFLGWLAFANAGEREEKILREKSVRAEASARPCDHLFRLMVVPGRPDAGYSFVTKLYLTRRSVSHEPSGWVTIKVRSGRLGFVERSRALKADEIEQVWKTFYEEEIFSLPVQQRESPGDYWDRVRDGATVVFSHFDRQKRRTEEVARGMSSSQPAARAVAELGKPFTDLVKELEKADPLRGRE